MKDINNRFKAKIECRHRLVQVRREREQRWKLMAAHKASSQFGAGEVHHSKNGMTFIETQRRLGQEALQHVQSK